MEIERERILSRVRGLCCLYILFFAKLLSKLDCGWVGSIARTCFIVFCDEGFIKYFIGHIIDTLMISFCSKTFMSECPLNKDFGKISIFCELYYILNREIVALFS